MTPIEGDFVGEFKQRQGFTEHGPAEQAIEAVLTTLGEVLPDELALEVASFLPSDLEDALLATPRSRASNFQQFLERVAEREGDIRSDEALAHSQLVVGLLAELAPDDEIERVRASLPEFELLFEIADRHLDARDAGSPTDPT